MSPFIPFVALTRQSLGVEGWAHG